MPDAKTSAKKPAPEGIYSESAIAAWYEGKTFSSDWTTWHFPNWFKLLGGYRDKPVRVVEIGSWEGRSALFFMNYLPYATLACIDTFAGGQEHREHEYTARNDLPVIEARFDANTAAFTPRIEKIKSHSHAALAQLGVAGRRFDIAYIDGSHTAADVYADGALMWPLMAPGGLVIFDDYGWDEMPEPLDNPKPGVDAFLGTIKGQYRSVLHDYQVAIIKK
jgi:cephalosporin hydroxylase